MALVAIPELAAPGGESRPVELTDREWEVARLVAEGHSNDQIAGELHLSVRTVENHLSHVYAKLDLGGRSELIVLLLEQRAPGP